MLFRQRFLDGIRAGSITLAFRCWRRPTVQSGGRLRTPAGELAISSVARISLEQISESDARAAGYESLDGLRHELGRRPAGAIYRIELGPLDPDPRIALRERAALTVAEQTAILERLRRLDARAPAGRWTRQALELIGEHPGVRAGDLCRLAGQDKLPFKQNVRKLKNLGLTESLEIGYRLSPRGAALLQTIRSSGEADAK